MSSLSMSGMSGLPMSEAEWLTGKIGLRMIRFLKDQKSFGKSFFLSRRKGHLIYASTIPFWKYEEAFSQEMTRGLPREQLIGIHEAYAESGDTLAYQRAYGDRYTSRLDRMAVESFPWGSLETLSLRSSREVDFPDILREHLGNPFRHFADPRSNHPVPLVGGKRLEFPVLDLRWLNEDVRTLTEGVYQTGDFGQAGILSDALEEAGAHRYLVEHLREGGLRYLKKCSCGCMYMPLRKDKLPVLSICMACYKEGPFWDSLEYQKHPKGCWVIDLLRGVLYD